MFDIGLLARPPIRMKPGDSLVSSISLKVGEKIKGFIRGQEAWREHHDDSGTRVAAVLTCMDKPQPLDAFRPACGDKTNKVYLARNLHREILPRLPVPENMIVVAKGKLTLDDWAEMFRKPWINNCMYRFEEPVENMPHYGREIARAVGIGALLLCLDLPPAEKETLLVPYVQVGIDYWGLIEAGHPGWPVLGGHHSGRKLPILIAGMLFDDGRMARPSVTYPKVSFQEDEQTMYGKGWTGATALFAGHSGILKATGRPGRSATGPYEHKHPSQWTGGDWTSEGYRRCCTSFTWVSEALALRILHAKDNWAHDAFFDYADRWMTEDDTEHRKEALKVRPNTAWAKDDQAWGHQRNCWDPIVQEMWDKYRNNLPPARGDAAR